jgi:hypothetical protein
MPLLESMGIPPSNQATIDVKDMEGKPVVRCEISKPDSNVYGRQTTLRLRAAATQDGRPGQLIGQCEAEFEPGGRRSAFIYDADHQLFAHVMRDPYRPSYVLSGISCPAMVFGGNIGEHVLNVTNGVQEPLADTEPCQPSFAAHTPHVKLRVLSGVDVGLVVCGLLSVIFLESR